MKHRIILLLTLSLFICGTSVGQEAYAPDFALLKPFEARGIQLHEDESDEPMKAFFTLNVAASLNPQFSYGFRIGTLRELGWNIAFMSNFDFRCFGAKVPAEGELLALYSKKNTRLGVTAGVTWHPTNLVLLFLNAGYGYRGVCYQRLSDEKFYLYAPHTVQGVEVSLGMMLNVKGFLISAEAATINFKYAELKLGFGGLFAL